jgi:N-acetylglutamate synthase
MSLSPVDVGSRVVVRRLVSDPAAERPQFSDLLGELVELNAEQRLVVVRTDAGEEVAIPVAEVAAAKRIPPRRGIVAHTTIPDLDLERIAALGWRGLESEWLGGWQLRAAGGWTGRSNSVLPLSDPGRELDAALEYVNAWYAARELPPTIQLPLPATESLRAALVERGWSDQWGALVLTASVAEIQNRRLAIDGLPPVSFAAKPSDEWLSAYHYRGGPLPPVAPAVLQNATAPAFAAVREHGAPIAICRLAADEGWVGITAVEVSPDHRRRGLATHLLAGAMDWAARNGVRNAYLQVDSDNAAALAMYEKAGFRVHHEYRYYRLADF